MSGTLVETPADHFLAHYGVAGMKWGKRKPRSPREQAKRNNMKKASDNRRHLSDKELTNRIDRIKKERTLKELTEEELKPKRTVAKKVTSKILSDSGQRVISALVVGAMAYGAKAALDQKFDRKEAFAYMTPANPNKKKK